MLYAGELSQEDCISRCGCTGEMALCMEYWKVFKRDYVLRNGPRLQVPATLTIMTGKVLTEPSSAGREGGQGCCLVHAGQPEIR